MKYLYQSYIYTCFLLLISLVAGAQEFAMQTEAHELSKESIKEIVIGVAEVMRDNYVTEAEANSVYDFLVNNQSTYTSFTDAKKLIQQLGLDIQSIIDDGHFNITYLGNRNFNWVSEEDGKEKKDNVEREADLVGSRTNYGLQSIKILEGNIGYINIASFNHSLKSASQALGAAFTFVNDTKALIIDVRENTGGQPEYVNRVLSFLWDVEHQLISTISYRNKNDITTFESASDSELEGLRYSGNRPVYVLTSDVTASGAEALAYHLQVRAKATIIGEKTLGAANGFTPVLLSVEGAGYIAISVPDMLITDQHSNSNWEKVGVTPDIEVASKNALRKSHLLALEKLKSKASNADEMTWYNDLIQKQRFITESGKMNEEEMESYTGTFGIRKVLIESGRLKMQRESGPKFDLIQTGEDLFELNVPVSPKPKVKFVRKNDEIVGFNLIQGDSVKFNARGE